MQKRYIRQYLLKLLNRTDKTEERRREEERRLINAESSLGRRIFGEVPEGYNREFFCLNNKTWLWYENGSTILYEIRKDGVYKKVDSGYYKKIEGQELKNFHQAVKTYLKTVKENIYK